MQKQVAILGSTGSIGTQTLEVIEKNPDHFKLEILTARNNADVLIAQSRKFLPNHVVITNEDKYNYVSRNLSDLPVKVYAGTDALEQIVEMDSVDIIMSALVGFSGLQPTLRAIRAGKDIALANKETLVVGGDLVIRSAIENNVNIYPVDSEHSAIFQCIVGEEMNPIEKIILTASGGPFLGKDREYLRHVTREEALKHPNWCMGDKITIDSASLMNKGLEVIEAKWLFGLRPEQIEVIIHPQSIIHSLVQFEDGSLKAQLGIPDMKLPIQYALGFPKRLKSDLERFSFSAYPNLTFQSPDMKIFPNLSLAYRALNKGGNMPCVLNAANEVTVNAFLEGKLGFFDMSDVIEKTMNSVAFIATPDLNDYVETDSEARKIAESYLFR
ncbi:MAG: 1-deoxy-D-xylulose-5-phosphate reductoisomerase [Bacteroidales bacterium]|nr:1-deoxy-D-xylulose-5-phosphate reductoisomerase [Bacteroidales bacterium]